MSRLLNKAMELLASTDKSLSDICRGADVTYPWLAALKGNTNGTKYPAVDKIERLYEYLSGERLELTTQPLETLAHEEGMVAPLFDIGFSRVGCWRLAGDMLRFELTNMIEHNNVLYAFTSGDDVLYVARSTNTLHRRMATYLQPGNSQSTNLLNNAAIVKLLRAGSAVEILALPDLGSHRIGQFRINYSAALEDSIIQTLAPPWNSVKDRSNNASSSLDDDAAAAEFDMNPDVVLFENAISVTAPSFQLVLQPTYFNFGFFNVGVDSQHLFPQQGGSLDIYCGRERQRIKGRFDRTANTNGTPRVFGFAPLRDWFQRHCDPMQSLTVTVVGPTSLEIGRM